MKPVNDWSDLLTTLTEGIPADELEADILLADIAGKIAAERIKQGLSQQELADRLGVTQSQVSKMESGDNNFTIRRLVTIAHKLKMPLKILFGEKPIMEQQTSSVCVSSKRSAYQHAHHNNVITFPGVYCNEM